MKEIGKWLALSAFACGVALPGLAAAGGIWFTTGNNARAAVGLLVLLPDGSVMAENNPAPGAGYIWYRLYPDANGHYVNGTWSTNVAPMNYTRRYHSAQVLSDGRLFVAGGEYGTGRATAEIYDPQLNVWTEANPPVTELDPSSASPDGGSQGFSDSASALLGDGSVLLAPVSPMRSRECLIYEPKSDQWTNGIFSFGSQNEATWIKLPDNSILTVDKASTNAERYIPGLKQWVIDAGPPVQLFTSSGAETGPALLLPNGKAFFIGGTGHTAIYAPSGNASPGHWTAGPDLTNGLVAADAPAAIMPNGKILCAVSPPPYYDSSDEEQWPFETSFFEYDYTNGPVGTFTQVGAPKGEVTDNVPTFGTDMIVLPDGYVLYCNSDERDFPYNDAPLFLYQPSDSTEVGNRPAITSVAFNSDGSCHLIGTGLTGNSEGSSYGDDKQMNSNFPLVQFIDPDTGAILFARTYNWSSTGVQTGGLQQSTDFMPPAGLAVKTYKIRVVVNGFTSDTVDFSFVTPNPLMLCPGENGALYATPPTVPATYQWYFDNNPLPGETSSQLNFVSASTNQSGYYSVKVTTGSGSVVSPPVQVSVGVWIITPPSATTYARLCQSNMLSTIAQGHGVLNARWFRNGHAVVLGSTGITTNIELQPGGGIKLSLRFADVEYQDDGTYTAVVTDDCSSSTTTPCDLRVLPNPPWLLVDTNGPASRYYASMTYDPFRHVAVLFGGQTHSPTGSPVLGDTWEFDGTNWAQRFPANSPSPRAQAQMTFDPFRLQCILFGGEIYTNGQFQFSPETWTWDGLNWHQIKTPNAPNWTQPEPFGSCFDTVHNEMLIFGGLGASGQLSQLWALDGTNWTQKLPPGPTPVASGTTLMTFDEVRGVAVLLGCQPQAFPSPYPQSAVWEWDGSLWHEKQQSGQVFGGASAIDALAFDYFRGESVLYGSVQGIIDGVLSSAMPYPEGYRFIWRWNGTQWQVDPPSATPGVTLSLYPSMCFDFARNAIELFGGEDNSGALATNNTYELIYQDVPSALKQPTIQVSAYGTQVQLTVLAAGAQPIAYQWQKDGLNLTDGNRISGAETNVLTINPSNASDSGEYLLTMSNQCGIDASLPINLLLTSGPNALVITALGSNVVIGWTDSNAQLQLQTAPTVTGPWSTISGATSPYTYTVNRNEPARFFRLESP